MSQRKLRREHDREQAADARAGGDADEARIGERVPHDRLHERAGRSPSDAPTSAPATMRGKRIVQRMR